MDLNSNLENSSFLGEVAKTLLERHPNDLYQIRVVFPNRRAKLFLEREFQKIISKPIWLPTIEGFDDFIQHTFSTSYSSDLEIKMHLFQCYQNIYGKQHELEDFLKWSGIILSDFNDILESEVNFVELLEHLEKVRTIENWSPEDSPPSKLQNEYLNFWKKLPELFKAFIKPFEENKLFTRSFAEREFANNFNQVLKAKLHQNSHFYFIGFNALSGNEQKIFKAFKQVGKASFFWDVDAYYFENLNHEAGKPIKSAAKKLGENEVNFSRNQLIKNPKEINIFGAQGNFNQAKVLATQLAYLQEEEQKQTAVVLGNSTILPQVLNSLPANIKTVNISAGLSIQSQPLYQLLYQLIRLWKQQEPRTKKQISYSFFKQILYNNFLKKLITKNEVDSIKGYLLKHNLVYIDSKCLNNLIELLNPDSPLKNLFLLLKEMLEENLDLEDFIKFINRYSSINTNKLNVIEAATFDLLIEGFSELLNQVKRFSIKPTANNVFALFKYLIQPLELSFLGEPLQGLQIIGLLETRNITFKNVIILSVNEGTFPQAKNQESLIPYDVRKAFGLPTHELKDGIFSYHFYRLIQGAEKVDLIYNTSSDRLGKGEKSRFIQQIETEKPLSRFIKSNVVVNPLLQVLTEEPLRVKVNKEKLIHYLTERGLSPSALNTYLENPLEFYYRYVESVYETDELDEVIDAATLGDIIHQVLEDSYKPFINKNISSNEFQILIKEISDKVEIEFEKIKGETLLEPGKNLILKEVSKSIIEKTLMFDSSFSNFKILGVEEQMKTQLNLSGYSVVLKGLIDRIDSVDGKTRIIDYKTGKVEDKELKIQTVNELFEKPYKPKALQLMFYAYLFANHKNYQKLFPVSSGIFSLRSISKGIFPLTINSLDQINQEILFDFEVILKDLIQNMLESEFFVENLNFEYQPFYHF